MCDRSGDSFIDFSANINPLGMHPAVRQALVDSVALCDRYPDPQCRDLREALELREGWHRDAIVCGNGASDLLFRMVQTIRPRKALVSIPSFSEYEAALASVGCEITWYSTRLSDGFQVTLDMLDAITDDIDMVIVCDPGNPVGTSIGAEVLDAVSDRCRRVGSWCLVDRCFEDFVGSGKLLKPLNDRMIVLKAFTKSHALAGVRIGHALFGDPSMARSVMHCGQSWPVSICAQSAGTAAAKQDMHLVQARALVAAQRGLLMESLRSLGMKACDSDANYVCFSTGIEHVADRLACRGLYIRDCSNYRNLGQGWYRIAVRTAEQNRRLLDGIGRLVGEEQGCTWERC